jgi:predicted ATPase/DNA-binding SARP family transcriptional activator
MTGSDRATSLLSLRLFGPFEACLNGEALPRLRSRKGLHLLALLALRPGRELERAWLAGTLWPDSSEAAAFANLRNTLTDLRPALGEEAARLRAPTPHSLSLDLSGAEVDVLAFDAAMVRGDPPSLEEAVSLYRGPLLEGWVEEWAFQEREQRQQAYLRALETLASQALAGGEPEAAEGYLRRAVAAEPLRESAQRALMQALAAGGSYAAAVEVYRELRLTLHRELSAEPDAETRELFHQIRAEARSKAVLGSTDRPEHGSAAIRHNLPRQLTRFIGRAREMAEVKKLLPTTALLTLAGPGGCGKTRLALQVAADQAEEFPDGTWLVELAALSDPSLVPQAVAAVLGIHKEAHRPLSASLSEYLRQRHPLLILDNCEHLLSACAHLTDDLLRTCPDLSILVTSREPLGIHGEQIYRVPSLSLPDRRPDALLASEAVQLFVDRALLSRPDFALTEANGAAVAQICRRLDGIPLAIELAAARVKGMPAEQIAAGLDDRFRLLIGGSRTALPRQQTLRALIDWSYGLLSQQERTLLRRLSVFAGGWTLEAAEAVCSNAECGMRNAELGEDAPSSIPHSAFCILHSDEVRDLLTQLVDKSLVLYEEQRGEGRYRMLETLRQYGWERLVALGEAEVIHGRHRDAFLALAEEVELNSRSTYRGEKPGLDRLDRELDNLRAALEWSLEQGQADQELRLAGALADFWIRRDHWEEGRQWLEGALARTQPPPAACESLSGEAVPVLTRARVRALAGAGHLATELSDHAVARSRLQEGVRLCRVVGDKNLLAWSLFHLFYETGEPSVGEESVALYREIGNGVGLVYPLYCLGNRALQRGDDGAARAHYEESLAIAREWGDTQALARPIAGLAALAWGEGDYPAAQSLYEETVALRRDQKDTHVAHYLNALGNVLCEEGDCGRATALLEESLALSKERGNKRAMAGSLVGLAGVARRQGDLETARTLCEQGLELFQEVRDTWGVAQSLTTLGAVAHSQGDYARARCCYEQGLALARELETRWGSAASLGPWSKLGNPRYIAECLEGLAATAGAQQP